MSNQATAIWASLFQEIKSRRGLANVHYRMHALTVLGHGKDPAFYWLANHAGMVGGDETWRPTVLTELGRIEDDELLLAVARELCKAKPKTTADAVARIRRARLDPKPADTDALASNLRATINAYLTRHPDTEWPVVLEAIANVERDARSAMETKP